MTYRVGTHADVCEWFGKLPRETLRAVVILLDGRLAGIIGLGRAAAWTELFSDHKPELAPHLSSVAVWRAVKLAMRFVNECRAPVFSVSSDARLMARLGFHEVNPGIWRI